jgi:hypothetical protein
MGCLKNTINGVISTFKEDGYGNRNTTGKEARPK